MVPVVAHNFGDPAHGRAHTSISISDIFCSANPIVEANNAHERVVQVTVFLHYWTTTIAVANAVSAVRSSWILKEGAERKWSILTKEFVGNDKGELTGIKLVDIEWGDKGFKDKGGIFENKTIIIQSVVLIKGCSIGEFSAVFELR